MAYCYYNLKYRLTPLCNCFLYSTPFLCGKRHQIQFSRVSIMKAHTYLLLLLLLARSKKRCLYLSHGTYKGHTGAKCTLRNAPKGAIIYSSCCRRPLQIQFSWFGAAYLFGNCVGGCDTSTILVSFFNANGD